MVRESIDNSGGKLRVWFQTGPLFDAIVKQRSRNGAQTRPDF
jgi:hypothetical protein